MNLEANIQFLQLKLIKAFNLRKDYPETYNTNKFVIKCKYYGKKQEINKNKSHPLEKCSNFEKEGHFQVACKQKRLIERKESTNPPKEQYRIVCN